MRVIGVGRMLILVSERSQALTRQLRACGHNAFSCDPLAATGDHPEWHLRGDVQSITALRLPWDMIIGATGKEQGNAG
jgi:hypothetical protein